VVVGAGAAGLAAARALARGGREVLVLEQFEVGHPHGSSHGGSRIFRLSYPDERWVRLAQAALPLWHELEAEAGERLIERHGTIDVGDVEPNRAALAAAGAPYELLDGAEVSRRFPLSLPADARALWQPDGGISYADRSLLALLASARAAGAELRERTRVAALEEADGGVRLVTAAGEVQARAAVVTAGAWAPGLVELDATVTRETTTYFELEEPAPSLIDWFRRGADEELGFALVAPGIGLKAGLHHSGPTADPDEPGEPDARIVEWTSAWVASRFPGAGRESLRAETCLYTNRDDEEFVLERRGRVVVGSACSGHGFKFAPEVGRVLAALAVEAAA
jgi:sarcosine oxidase